MNKIEVTDGKLIISKPYLFSEDCTIVILEVDIKELADALKPFLKETL